VAKINIRKVKKNIWGQPEGKVRRENTKNRKTAPP